MGKKVFVKNELIDKETIAITIVIIFVVWLLSKKSERFFKRKEPYDKQKTIIKYLPDDDSISMIKDVSGLGLNVVQFVFNNYPGFCCLSCGPTFHVTLHERDNDLICSCSLCSMALTSEEKKQVKSFTSQLFSPRKLGNFLVMCSNNSSGCDVILPLKELKEHVEHCAYTKILCPRTCGITLERHRMDQHVKLCRNTDVRQQVSAPYPTPAEPYPHPSCPPPPYETKER